MASTSFRYQLLVRNLFLFSLSPIVGTLVAMFKRKKEDLIVLFMFTAWFSFVIRPSGEDQDLYRHMENLQYLSYHNIWEVIKAYLNGEIIDPFLTVLQVVVSRNTDNAHILLLIAGMILGVFYAYSIKLFSKKADFISFVLVFIFSFIVGLDRLGGIRNIIAFYIYFVSISYYIKYGDRRNLLLLLLTFLVHFSSLLYIGIFGVYLLVRKMDKLLFAGMFLSVIVSLFITSLGIDFQLSLFGDAINNQIQSYTTGTKGEQLQETARQLNWQVRLSTPLMCYGQVIVMMTIRKMNIRYLTLNKPLLSFVLLFIIFANLLSVVPDLSGWIAMFSFAFLIYYVETIKDIVTYKHRVVIVWMLFVFSSLHIYHTFRQILYILDVEDIILPVFVYFVH